MMDEFETKHMETWLKCAFHSYEHKRKAEARKIIKKAYAKDHDLTFRSTYWETLNRNGFQFLPGENT